MILNKDYEILNAENTFVDFLGIKKEYKDSGYKVTLENDNFIIVSEDHIFLANEKNMFVSSLIPNVNYITTTDGDKYVKKIERVEGEDFYDIVDSENTTYVANNILNHNCSFLGSGDNFIAEKYLERIEEDEIRTPIKQEYIDLCMWIWEDPIEGEDYYMTIDSSSGHGEDYSTINIFKVNETIKEESVKKNNKTKKVKIRKTMSEQVAEYYGKISPTQLAEIAYQYGRKYNMAYCICDVTGGYGIQTIQKLYEIGYENIHHSEVTHKPTRDQLQGYVKQGQKILPDGSAHIVDLLPGFYIGSNRPSILLEMQSAIHNASVIVRSYRLLRELKTFVTVSNPNRVADHKRSFHDDSIMGMACFLYVLTYDQQKYKQSKETTEKILNSMMSNNDVDELRRKKVDDKPLLGSRNVDPNNPYHVHGWLFSNLKKKK